MSGTLDVLWRQVVLLEFWRKEHRVTRAKKVVVIGLDGLEPSIVEPMMARGELPNLSRLAAQGGYTRLGTTSPAQTPVAWSTFATGLNPGGHGIFDFISRDPLTYLPDLALNRFAQKNAFTPPKAVNRRHGEGLWTTLAYGQVKSSVIRCPCTFPPDALDGKMLSGMGVPDLRGGLGTGTYYVSGSNEVLAGEGEQISVLTRTSGTTLAGHLIGPRGQRGAGDLTLPLEIRLNPDSETVLIRCPGAKPEEVSIRLGTWSPWMRVRFKIGLLQSARGMVRFYLRQISPEVEIYASPINFDPKDPLFPISEPAEFSQELADELGLFYTTGMAEDHAALMNGRIEEHAFLQQCSELWDERQAMLMQSLEQTREGLVFCLFDTPDRVQHLFWRFLEPDHPANHGQAPDPQYLQTIAEQYRRADATVGAAVATADDKTLVIAMSDHGFGSFRRCVELNTWLKEKGLLRLNNEFNPGDPEPSLLRGIDWEHTQAYAVGLGGIYLNLRGREARGIVSPEDIESLESGIIRSLSSLKDPTTDLRPVREVRRRRELYSGPHAKDSPDLMVHCERGYRIGWSTGLGGIAHEVLSDNTKRWSGDHIFDPAVVPGVLFMNRPFQTTGCRLEDLAPTILAVLGVNRLPIHQGNLLLS